MVPAATDNGRSFDGGGQTTRPPPTYRHRVGGMDSIQQHMLDSYRATLRGEPVPPSPGRYDRETLRTIREYRERSGGSGGSGGGRGGAGATLAARLARLLGRPGASRP